MKKLLFLIAALSACHCYAQLQTFEEYVNAHRETSFEIPKETIYHTHTIHLRDNERMIVELTDVTDYVMIKNLDSILQAALADAAFYKDSATALQNVRIDYDIKLESDNILMRFKKYNPDGDIYVKQHGELSRMKIARDTFRLIFRKPMVQHHSLMYMDDYPVQVTFLMNNYANLYTLIQEKGLFNKIIDTVSKETFPKVYSADYKNHTTTVQYWPLSRGKYMSIDRKDTDNIPRALKRNKYYRQYMLTKNTK